MKYCSDNVAEKKFGLFHHCLSVIDSASADGLILSIFHCLSRQATQNLCASKVHVFIARVQMLTMAIHEQPEAWLASI